jgi:hypothetical protein
VRYRYEMQWRKAAELTYEKKFAAWEQIVERANTRVFTIQTMRVVRQPAVSIRNSRPIRE